MNTYPPGLERFKEEFKAIGAILEVFDCCPLAQIIVIKTPDSKIYMQEFYYSEGNWAVGSTRLHSLETGVHLLCHTIRYWQKEIANEVVV